MSEASDYAKAAHGVSLGAAEADGAAASAKGAAEGLSAEIGRLPFGAEAPSYRSTLLRLAGRGDGHGRD